MREKVDLFTSVTASVIAFPLSRQSHNVLHAARVMTNSTDDQTGAFWADLTHKLALPLTRAGLSDDVVRAELISFRDAVQLEMANLDHDPSSGQGRPLKGRAAVVLPLRPTTIRAKRA